MLAGGSQVSQAPRGSGKIGTCCRTAARFRVVGAVGARLPVDMVEWWVPADAVDGAERTGSAEEVFVAASCSSAGE